MISETGDIEVRDDASDDGRTISGYAVRWSDITEPGATAEYGSARESFRAGAFRDALRKLSGRLPIIDRHGETAQIVGYADDLGEDATGLRFAGRLLTSQAARDYAERVGAGMGSVSLEFQPGQVARSADTVQHTGVRKLIAIAGSYRPAYAGALASVRDQEGTVVAENEAAPVAVEPVPDERLDRIGEEVAANSRGIAELRRGIAESRMTHVADDPYAAIRSMSYGEFMQRALTDTELRNVFTRALSDNITSESPGVMTPGVIQDVKRIVGTSRVGIDAFGVRPLGDGGMNVEWPYTATALGTLVGEQVTQKTEIVSADVPILKGTAPIKTYAGGSDIAYQLIRRSSPSYLEAFGRIMLSAWAAVTNTAFVDQLEALATGTFVYDWGAATDINIIREKVFLGSLMVQDATGSPAEFVLCGATPFVKIGGALNGEGTSNGQAGDALASTLAPVLSGLRVLYDPNVNANTVLISNRTAAGWHEDGPFSISDEDIAKLGRDVAVWSMGAAACYNPLGVVKTTPV